MSGSYGTSSAYGTNSGSYGSGSYGGSSYGSGYGSYNRSSSQYTPKYSKYGSSSYQRSNNPFNEPKIIRLGACCQPPIAPPPCCLPPPCFLPPPPCCLPPPCFLPPPPCCVPPLPAPCQPVPPPPPPPQCCPPCCKTVFRVPKGCSPPLLAAAGDGGTPLYNNCNFYTSQPPPQTYQPNYPMPMPFLPGPPGGIPYSGPANLLNNVLGTNRNLGGRDCGGSQVSSCDRFFDDLDLMANDSSTVNRMGGKSCSDNSSSKSKCC